MKLIALSDIHGAYDRANAILRSEQPFDGILLGGDLTTLGSPGEASSALDGLLSHGAPVAAVCGNMDPSVLDEVLVSKRVSVNASGMLWGTTGLFGVSGSPPTPMQTPYEISEEEIARRAASGWRDVEGADRTIFIPHAPPRGTSVDRIRSGSHVGSTAVREFIETHRPTLTVCGHIHEARGTDSIGDTIIVNCGQAERGFYVVIILGEEITVQMKEFQ